MINTINVLPPDSVRVFGPKTAIPQLSIIIPTYNEAGNIIRLLESIKTNIGISALTEIIVVDDNSPDGTGNLVDDYINKFDKSRSKANIIQIRTIHRKQKEDLIQALLQGIECSLGEQVIIMAADLSHPPETIPKIIENLQKNDKCVIVASRHVKGSVIKGWTFKRRILSWGANSLARMSLGMGNIKDPMSGFFAFHKKSIENIQFNTKGYKLLLELLVKGKKIKVIEIPYVFTDRLTGQSKMDYKTTINYLRSLWKLYRYGKKANLNSLDEKNSIKFLSKAGRFFTVGASGLLVNYLVSILLSSGLLAKLWYMESTLIGIVASITSNFILNKLWTFGDRDFSPKHLVRQYLFFLIICSFGASIQLGLVYILVESMNTSYELALLLAVVVASVSNFILNKKFTFKEKIWG